MDKKSLRSKYLEIRKTINKQIKTQYDNKIFNKIIKLEEYEKSKLILIYVSFEIEVDTLKLIKYTLKQNKKVAVPKCDNNIIKFYYINNLCDLEAGNFNILEPITNNIVECFENSICIVPGIVFDKQNNRVGYGKGYYDKFLKNYNGMKIGLTYNKCLCEEISIDKYDIKMDKVITN